MAKQQILTYSVTFGDWSGDGHGIHDVSQVEIRYSGPGRLTEAKILKNYQANVAKLGFGLPELWEEYEQYVPTADQIKRIKKVFGVTPFAEYGGIPAPKNAKSALEILSYGGPLKLAMLIVLTGIENVEWVETPRAPSLFGGANSILTANDFVGYGLKGV